jgi:putative phage-type endonuclease
MSTYEAARLVGRRPDPDTWRTNPAMRRTFIGGSDAAAVLGIDPYRSPVALWLEKTGQEHGFGGNEATEWGHRLEPVVADWLADARPNWTIIDPGERTWRHPWRHYMACTPDRIADDPTRNGFGVVQIKTSGWRSASEWEAGDAPDQHRVQLAHEMEVLGASWGVLVCLVDGRQPHIVHQDPDPAITDVLITAEARFWKSIDGDMPPLAGHLDEASDLAAVWHPNPDATVELDAEAADALAELHEVRAQAKTLEAAEKRLRAVIEAAMGEATVATVDGVKAVTWSARTEVDIDLLAADHPDVVHACQVPTFSATALRQRFPVLAKDDTYRRTAGRTFKPLPPKDTPT